MSDYQLHLPASPHSTEQLKTLVSDLAASVERSVGSSARIVRQNAEVGEGSFTEHVAVKTERGTLEVMVRWAASTNRVDVSIGSSVAPRGPLAHLPLVLALGAAFYADKSPELLPVLRGVRVAVGATVGVILGFLLLGAVSMVLAARLPRVDAAFEQQVTEAVRDVMLARGADASDGPAQLADSVRPA